MQYTEQQKSLKSYSQNATGVKKASKKGHFAHIGNEIKICSQNKCHHHLSNVCENSFCMFHSNWVISDNHSFVWQFEFPWLNFHDEFQALKNVIEQGYFLVLSRSTAVSFPQTARM